jgi:hypothetical protein
MTPKEKREHLQDYSEDRLRQEVLVPLLTKLGFHDPITHHHAGEKGKDIVCKEFDEKFGKIKYIAVVVKRGDVTGSASGSNSYFTVINQINQALNEPYKHVYELREVMIDQVILVISGDFVPTALESIYGTLKAEKVDKAIRDAIDIGKLILLIDSNFPEFWQEIEDQKASLIRQRNILLNNLGKLLKVFIPDAPTRDSALRRLAAEELDVDFLPFKDMARYMLDIGYRKVSIEEIDPAFTTPFLNTDYGNIKQSVFELKKKVQKVLMEIGEEIVPLRRILQETNPNEILGLCEDVKYYTNFYGRMDVDVSKIIYNDDLEGGIKQYEERRELLAQTQKSALYTQLMEDMHNKLEPALGAFWAKYPREVRDRWLGYSVRFSIDDATIVESATYEFQQEPIIVRDDAHFKERETSKAFVDERGSLHVEYAVNCYGIINEEKLTLEQKVVDFVWYYEQLLAEEFFKLLELSKTPTRGLDE